MVKQSSRAVIRGVQAVESKNWLSATAQCLSIETRHAPECTRRTGSARWLEPYRLLALDLTAAVEVRMVSVRRDLMKCAGSVDCSLD